MENFKSEWREYGLNLCKNYRDLKDFIENQADSNWPFYAIRSDYLKEMHSRTKISLKKYFPNEDLNLIIDEGNHSLPPDDALFFSHLPFQLTFCKQNRIQSILDYHFREYLKVFPNSEESFLTSIEDIPVYVIEHNEIGTYATNAEMILYWTRHKREHLQIIAASQVNIQVNTQNILDFSVISLSQQFNNYTSVTVPPPADKSQAKKEKDDKGETDCPIISVKVSLKEKFVETLFESIENGSTEKDKMDFVKWLEGTMSGKPSMKKQKLLSANLGMLCRKLKVLYDIKKAFPGTTKKALSEWIVFYFRKKTSGGNQEFSFNTVYNILKGSKKSKKVP